MRWGNHIFKPPQAISQVAFDDGMKNKDINHLKGPISESIVILQK